MKHTLFLRRQDLCGHVQRWLLLPKTAGQPARNSWEMGLSPASGCLYLVNLLRLTSHRPQPRHTPAERSYYVQGSLCTIIGGRWLRVGGRGRKYKGGPDSNFD